MKGWILYRKALSEIDNSYEFYEVNSFLKSAKSMGIELNIIKSEQVDIINSRDDRKSIRLSGETVSLPDFILPRRGASTTYFDFAVIRHLERLGVKAFPSSHAVEIVKDKLYTQQILAEQNFPVPKTMFVKKNINIDLVEKEIGFPLVLKTISGTQGKGVYLCKDKSQFEDMLEFTKESNENSLIIQEFIESSYGQDIRIIVVGGRVLGAMKRIGKNGDFKANYSRGGGV